MLCGIDPEVTCYGAGRFDWRLLLAVGSFVIVWLVGFVVTECEIGEIDSYLWMVVRGVYYVLLFLNLTPSYIYLHQKKQAEGSRLH
jgi:hypothetical protein